MKVTKLAAQKFPFFLLDYEGRQVKVALDYSDEAELYYGRKSLGKIRPAPIACLATFHPAEVGARRVRPDRKYAVISVLTKQLLLLAIAGNTAAKKLLLEILSERVRDAIAGREWNKKRVP
jgi:hypothetical protein